MNIPREETIRKHREMWNWIAEQYEDELDGLDVPVNHLKAMFIKEHYPNDDPLSDCYCCEYAGEILNPKIGGARYNCRRCPLIWPSNYHECMCLCKNGSTDSDGLYGQIICESHPHIANYKKAATIAREIANLPERKNEEE